MRNPLRRRYMLERYGVINGRTLPRTDQEPDRRYWTHAGALRAEIRLNSYLMTARSVSRFRLVRLP